ncbi:hypothetical protein CENSYa_0654 [Cenarchaeum symbiosum A]|uniref:Blue (type 1) copper domain-containing protein n=1 Tax=Cenarchaeum symbiosum (strain A) TaxID=414004 RepID=A0RVC0_CENSY|nr:hypothetical protein CENSYa_0654 [Cenarchaeum symbiosum A]
MKGLNISWFFTLFVIAAITVTTAAYADRPETIVIMSEDSHMPGCEEANECYIPSDVTIEQGGSITWINEGKFFHTVTSGASIGEEDGLFDSGSVEMGETYTRIFREGPGDYPYFCSVHPWHTGIITVAVAGYRDSGYDSGDERGYDSGDERGYDSGDERGYDSGDERGYDSGDERGYDSGDERGYDSGDERGYDSGDERGYDSGDERGYDSGDERGYDSGDERGYDSGDERGYDSGDERGYDSGDERGYDSGDERGYDSGDERGYDSGDERGYDSGDERGYDSGDERGYDSGDERELNYTTSVLYAAIDRQTGVLEIVFDDTVDITTIRPDGIQIKNDTVSSLGITLSEMELVDEKNPGTVKFRLTEENRQEVIRYAQPLLYFGPTVLSDYGEELFGISPRLTGFEHADALDTGGRDNYFRGLAFSDDGTQMFMLGRGDQHMYRYDLSQPYNTTDSSFVDSVYIGPEDGSPIGFSFSPNGTMLFVLSYVNSGHSSVHAYSLSEPYEIIAPLQVGSHNLDTRYYYRSGIYFSTAGDLMFISDYRNIQTYKLAVPYNVSTAEYNSTQETQTSIQGMVFSPEGTRLFLMEYSMLDQYDLAEPYNLSSLNRSGSVDLRDNDATGLAFSGNGTKMFILQEDYVQEYHLPHTYDIAAPERDIIFHTGGRDNYFRGLAFSDDGTQMFMLGRGDQHMYRYDLSQPYNTTDSSFVDSVYIGPEDGSPIGFSFSPNGTMLFVLSYVNSGHSSVHAYSLSEPYEIIAPLQVGSHNLDTRYYYRSGIYFSTAGDLMFISDYRNIQTYKLAVPYNVSTAEYNSTQETQTSIQGMVFSPEGTRLFLMEYSMLDQYDLAEPYNLSSLNRSGSVDLRDNDATGLAFSGNGTKMFILQEDYVQEYELPIPFTIDLSRLVTSRNGLDSSGSVYDVAFSADGMAMFAGIAGHDAVYRYNLTSPYNTTSPLYVGMGRLGGDDDAAGIAFSADGSTMFVTRHGGYKYSYGYNSNQYVQEAKNASVHSYGLSSPYYLPEPAASGSFELEGVHGTGGIAFSDGGMYVFVVAGESIRRYSLPSPYNITSPVPSGSYDLEEHIWQPSGLEFSPDGMRMFVSQYRHVYGHDLGSAYNLDQAEYLGSFYTGRQEASGLSFSADGTGLFVAGDSSISRYEPKEQIPQPTVEQDGNGMRGPDAPAMVETVSMDHQIAFASNTLQPDPQPVSQPNPQPDPRPRGGGGGGGGGTSTGITSIGRDVSLEFTADGEDASRGSSEIIIGTNMPLVISPLSADDLDVYDMEVIISSEDGQAKIYYNRIGAFFDRECEGDAAASGSLYTCDVQSLISPSGASYRDDSDGSFESLAVPLEGEFSGTMSMQLRDNSGIILASHDKVYRINPSSAPVNAPDTGPAPEVIIPVQVVLEPEMDPEPVAVPEPEMDPEPETVSAESKLEVESITLTEHEESDTATGAEDPEAPTPAATQVETGQSESRQEHGIMGAITEFFRSLLGL